MPTIAIVGAGPGMGLSLARLFGGHGYSAALVSRSRENLDALLACLEDEGVVAAGFTADVMDRPTLVDAFAGIRHRFVMVDVLEYSPATLEPAPGIGMVSSLDVTVENLQPYLDYQLHGAIAATQEVLPEMLERRTGSLLYTTGASS